MGFVMALVIAFTVTVICVQPLSQRPWFIAYTPCMAIQVGILALHFRGSSPFKTYPVKMWTFVFAMLTNVGAALYHGNCRITSSRRSEICDLDGCISGSLASAAFLSILVPPSLVPLVFVVWMLHLPIYVEVACCNWIRKWLKALPRYVRLCSKHLERPINKHTVDCFMLTCSVESYKSKERYKVNKQKKKMPQKR